MARIRKDDSGDVDKARRMARQLLVHHFKTPPHRVIYQVGGLTNCVFIVHHDEGEFVIRIGQNAGKINAYIKEQWAVSEARKAGVPTSEILEVGNEVIPSPYMISRLARGQAATHHPERKKILRELGNYTARIHSIQTQGFGSVFDWSNNQLSRHETWNEFLFQELSLEARLGILGKHKMLPPPKIKVLGDVLEKGPGKKARPALNHGDIRLKNVLVDNRGKITALIDWEDCMSSLAPHWDLSLALHDLSIDEKLEFLDGYGLETDSMTEIAPLVKAINIINYVPHIEHLARAGDTTELARYRMRLAGVLDLYSL